MKKFKIRIKNKKYILSVSVAVVVIVAIAAAVFFSTKKIKPVDTVKLSEITKAQDITLIGHRGLSSQAPENTIPAFELAAEKGLKAVEFDIQPTKDGVWVLSHDDTLRRMTDGTGKISDYTFFDLADFNIDNGANYEKYQNLKMPSLDNALESCLKNGLTPMIEIKEYNEKSVKRLTESIVSHGFEESCQVISFSRDALEAVRKYNKNITLVYLVEKLDDDEMAECLEKSDIGVSFKADTKHNGSDKIKKLLSNDITLYCWVVDDSETLDYYYKAGVRNFVTNRIIP